MLLTHLYVYKYVKIYLTHKYVKIIKNSILISFNFNHNRSIFKYFQIEKSNAYTFGFKVFEEGNVTNGRFSMHVWLTHSTKRSLHKDIFIGK